MDKRASYKPDVPDGLLEGGAGGAHGAPRQNAAARKAAGRKARTGRRSALSRLRASMPAAVLLVLAVAFALRVPVGNLSSFGWETVSLICPVGALSTLLAAKSFVPQAVASLLVVAVLAALFGRAFCGWVCSVPLVQNVLGVEAGAARKKVKRASYKRGAKGAVGSGCEPAGCPGAAEGCAGAAGGCAACASRREKRLDVRHWVLGGSLVSAAAFGFPVFCVVCPVGLAFATVFLLVRLFSGSVSWALLVVPAMLVVELVFLRRWCHAFCPIGALASLLSKANRTFVPAVDRAKCLEAATGHMCGRCAAACPEGIDLRDLAAGRPINECVKCRRCVDACPKGAVRMPFLPAGAKAGAGLGGRLEAEAHKAPRDQKG